MSSTVPYGETTDETTSAQRQVESSKPLKNTQRIPESGRELILKVIAEKTVDKLPTIYAKL